MKPYVKKGYFTIQKMCRVCGGRFLGSSSSKYCSDDCRWESEPEARRRRTKNDKRRERYASDPEFRKKLSSKSSKRIMAAYKKNPVIRIKFNLRKRIRDLLRTKISGKSELVGCTPEELKAHIQSQWQKWMTWENYGTRWVIDHRIPLARFDLNNESQRTIACHFTNLQPMERRENQAKAAAITDGQYRLRM